MDSRKAQGSFEYVLMLSGVLLIVITIVFVLQNTTSSANNTVGNTVKTAGAMVDPSYYIPGAKPVFVPPTPADGAWGTSQPNISAIIMTNNVQLTGVTYGWNGANYSFYDPSLVLSMGLDDNPSIGETAAKAVDVSQYGNNGTIYDETMGLWHMDENAGSKIYDSTVNANNGTCYYNGAVSNCNWTAGVSGSALNFDGTTSYVSIPNSASLNISGSQMSMGAWFTTPNVTAGYSFLLKKQTPGYSLVLRQDGALEADIFHNTSGFCYSTCASSKLNPNTWYDAVVTYAQGQSTKIYLNGILNATCADPWNMSVGFVSSPLQLGVLGWWGSNNVYFNGTMDEVWVVNRSLAATDVLNQYNAGRAKRESWTPSGEWNGAMQFDGVTDQVIIPDSPSLDPTNAITVAAWAKMQQMYCGPGPGYVGCHDQELITKGSSTYCSNYSTMSLNYGWGNDFYFRLTASDGTTMAVQVPGGVANAAAWNYLAGTFNGTALNVYVNGVLANSSVYPSKNMMVSNSQVYLGRLTNGQTYQGMIDEPRIWNRALSAQEIATS